MQEFLGKPIQAANRFSCQEECCWQPKGCLPLCNNKALKRYTGVGKKMKNEQDSNNLILERCSIQAGWSPEEKKIRRRVAGNKQLQLKELMFLTAIASQKITRPPRSKTLMA
ncbi:MAG: hypothetical protein CMM01_06940 [Rhodopirellula sp.]|nr:hypothetical protein [Rhodopirellula sp.]OUX51883.1 MAG: hypothetical protein CBE43_02290 [Rhodopirellula sp. TMED283]